MNLIHNEKALNEMRKASKALGNQMLLQNS